MIDQHITTVEPNLSVVMLGTTGAVGGHAAATLASLPQLERLTLLGRRPSPNISGDKIEGHVVDIFDPQSYKILLPGHHTAVCALGVGQPSKVCKEEILKVDKHAVLDFARACKNAGVRHFELLGAAGANAASASFYLRTKGELEDGLRAIEFDRLSLFRPCMILTPINRYGLSQAIALYLWPLLNPLLVGHFRQFRGIAVDVLGKAIAINSVSRKSGVELLRWDDFVALAASDTSINS